MATKNKLVVIVIIAIIIGIVGFGVIYGYYINDPQRTSKFNLQITYFPTENSSIQTNELGLDNQSIKNINNETFSINIKSPETNKSVEYNMILHDNLIEIEFDEVYMDPRLDLGFIEENRNYSLEFIFNIMSNDIDIQNLNIWGDSNKIDATIRYNSVEGLVFTYAKNYLNVDWQFSDDADIILSFPLDINFGVYLGILEDY